MTKGFVRCCNNLSLVIPFPIVRLFPQNTYRRCFITEKDRVKKLLDPVSFYPCTTDLWTSRAQHSYISLTVHCLDGNFDLHSNLLETKEFSDSHTGINIAEELEGVLQDWIPLHGLVAFTTDNGTNVVSATEFLQCTQLPSLSHCLNLAVEKACSIPDVTKALSRCCRLVSHFNHSAKSAYLLKQKQEILNHRTLNLIQDLATRWNSSYYMVSRIIDQQQPLCAALLELKRTDLMPSDTELSTMETYVDIMRPLVTITEAIGAEKWITISSVRPILYKLFNSHLMATPSETQLKSEMLSDLKKRYSDDLVILLSEAAFLDPRLKALPFLSSSEMKKVVESIEDDTMQVAETCGEIEPTETVTEPPAKRKKGEHKLFNLIDDIMNSGTQDEQPVLTNLQKAHAEVSRYSSEPSSTNSNPLAWWQVNSFRYPKNICAYQLRLCPPSEHLVLLEM